MKSSAELVPNWANYALGRHQNPARIPGFQQVLLLKEIRELMIEGLPGIDWKCCATYTVRINGGGLESEIPIEPDTGYYEEPMQEFNPWNGLERLSEWLGDEASEHYVNPLSWPIYTPLMIEGVDEGPPGCIYDQDRDVVLAKEISSPLRAARIVKCKRVRHGKRGDALVNGFKLQVKAYTITRGVYFVELGGCYGYLHNGALYLEGKCSLAIESPYHDHAVKILYPGTFYELRVPAEGTTLGPLPAVSIGLWKKLSLASKIGVVLHAKTGQITIDVRGSLRASMGGERIAARIFIEDLLKWRPILSPEAGFGNTRASNSAFVFAGWRDNKMIFSIYNPISYPGVVDVRLPLNGEECMINGPMGKDLIPVRGDFLRIPVSAGFLGIAEIHLSEARFLRKLRMRVGRR